MEDYDRLEGEEPASSGDEGAESDEGTPSASSQDTDDSDDEGLETGGEKSRALRRRGRQETKRRPGASPAISCPLPCVYHPPWLCTCT